MDKDFLLTSALLLKQVTPVAAEEYNQKEELLIAKMNSVMIAKPDIESLIGINNISMMKDNHTNHARFMASIFRNQNAEVLVETIIWVFKAYRNHGFTINYWTTQLNTWIIIMKEILSPECYNEVYPYYLWMKINIPIFEKVSDQKPESLDSLH